MTGWTAIIPMKAKGKRKTRLAAHLSAVNRAELAEVLCDHVVRTVRDCPSITRMIVLSDGAPTAEGVEWIADTGTGLNAELERVRSLIASTPTLIIHADLPLLAVADVEGLLAASCQSGIAIAPDSHGTGTNALAIGASHKIDLRFGVNSFALHLAQAPHASVLTDRPGLALDIDTADDLEAARLYGFYYRPLA